MPRFMASEVPIMEIAKYQNAKNTVYRYFFEYKYFMPRFMASEVPIIQIANSKLLQIFGIIRKYCDTILCQDSWPPRCRSQGWLKVPYNVGIPTFKYEKIELLVCVYEISRELVFIYGIFGMFTMSDTGNHGESYSIPSQVGGNGVFQR